MRLILIPLYSIEREDYMSITVKQNKSKVMFTIDKELLERLDVLKRETKYSRSVLIERAIRMLLLSIEERLIEDAFSKNS